MPHTRADPTSGAMVALIPTTADADRLAVDGGEPAEQLHVTLYYLGEGVDFSDTSRAHLTELVRGYVAGIPVVQGDAFSVAVFNPGTADTAIVVGVGGEALDTVHNAVCAGVEDYGADLPTQHRPWVPHITLRYSADVALVAEFADRTGPITFDRVRVAFAGEHIDIPLAATTDPPAEYRATVGATLLPSNRSEPMPEKRPMQYGRAFAESSRAWMDEPAGSPIPFVASTMGVQRDGLDLRASGWRLGNFSRNSVFLWCHDYRSEPIGRTEAVADVDRLRSDVFFDQEDPRAVRIESKYRRRFLNAVSVGWDFVDTDGRALEWWRMTPEQMRDEAFYDLLELSAVPVPADPSALALRQRTALRSLGDELVALFDEQENPDSDVTAPELQAAVRAELLRLGLDYAGLAAEGRRLAAEGERLAAELDVMPLLETGPVVATVDEQVLARAIRAAFGDLPLMQIDERAHGRAAIPAHDTAVAEGSWDGPAAVAGCAASKAALRGIHAWVDPDGDPDGKSSYKFPHHAEPGGAANLNGVRNALARLPQAHIPEADRAAVERHLRRHLNAQSDNDGRGGDPPTTGVCEPANTPPTPTPDSAARAVVNRDAAQVVLAAFTSERTPA